MDASRTGIPGLRSPRLRVAAACAALGALWATPILGGAEGVYGTLPLKDREERLIQNAAAYEDLFLRRGYRYESPALKAFLTRVGSALAPRPTDPYVKYRFHILRDPSPNAFALPDGQVYVNTGMLAGIENEAQLAALLAHEVHHTAGHHGLLSHRSARRKIITGMVLGPLTLGVGDIFLAMSVMGYSRELEEEADRLGLKKMHAAGYDPRQMAALFDLYGGDPEGLIVEVKASKWSSHPELSARVASARAGANALLKGRPAGLKVNAAGYRRLARQVTLETIQDLIHADFPRAALEMARWHLSEDAADGARHLAVGECYLALGAREARVGDLSKREKRSNQWARYTRTREEREAERRKTDEGRRALGANMETARRAFLRALELDRGLAEAHRGLGYALDGLGRPVEAGKQFVIYLKARPQAPDRPVVLAHMREINDKIKKGGRSR